MSVGGGVISGLGSVPMWGHSPALDMIRLVPGGQDSLEGIDSTQVTLRILIVGQADMRHVLQTVGANGSLLELKNARIHFYVAEDFSEVIAREMLLLLLAIQPLSAIGLHEKSTQWLELYGNTLIRPKTRTTFLEMTGKLIDLVMKPEEVGIFDISNLLFREKDALVEIFKHWKSFGGIFPIQDNWKKRLEHHLGSRYDVRQNLFDYDYSMRLLEKRPSPTVISTQEYKKWRETGVAFADFDSEYSQPNVSLATGIATCGSVYLSYRGEIVTGPFISFGIEAEDAFLFEKENGKPKSTSCDISIHNLQKIFKTMDEVGKPLGELFNVTFLSPSTFGGPRFITKYPAGFFDAAYLSSSSAQWLIPPIMELLNPNATILVEDTEFLLEVRASTSEVYRDKVLELAKECELVLTSPLKEEGGSPYLQFTKRPKSSEEEASENGAISKETSEFVDAGVPSLVPPLGSATRLIELEKESEVDLNENSLEDTA